MEPQRARRPCPRTPARPRSLSHRLACVAVKVVVVGSGQRVTVSRDLELGTSAYPVSPTTVPVEPTGQTTSVQGLSHPPGPQAGVPAK